MHNIKLDPVEVLQHVKHILGHDVSLTEEELNYFLDDLKQLMTEDLIYDDKNGENSMCKCYCHVKSPDNITRIECPLSNSHATVCDDQTSSSNESNPIHCEKNFLPESQPPQSFIRPWQTCPSTHAAKNLKEDPVKLFHHYKSFWKQHRIPGETSHAALRWTVRGKMLGEKPEPLADEVTFDQEHTCICNKPPDPPDCCNCPCPCCLNSLPKRNCPSWEIKITLTKLK